MIIVGLVEPLWGGILVSLNFPLKHSYKNVPERPRIHINENQEEKKIDNLFHKIVFCKIYFLQNHIQVLPSV